MKKNKSGIPGTQYLIKMFKILSSNFADNGKNVEKVKGRRIRIIKYCVPGIQE